MPDDGVPKLSRFNPIRNYLDASPEERSFEHRSLVRLLIFEAGVCAVLFGALRLGFSTGMATLWWVNAAAFGLMGLPVVAMHIRDSATTGLAGARGTTDASVEAISTALRGSFQGEATIVERSGQHVLGCRTQRSTMSYGEWLVISVTPIAGGDNDIEALSWNTSPTVTLGTNRRNVRKLAAAIRMTDARPLGHKAAASLVEDWITRDLLTGDRTARPAWF